MPDRVPPTMQSAVPVLLTLSIPATARFLSDGLGFRVRHQTDGFAIFVRDAVTLNFTKCDDQKLVNWSACRVAVTGVDALHQEYAARGVLHARSVLRDTEYGTREFGVVDVHGALITFYEPTSAPPG